MEKKIKNILKQSPHNGWLHWDPKVNENNELIELTIIHGFPSLPKSELELIRYEEDTYYYGLSIKTNNEHNKVFMSMCIHKEDVLPMLKKLYVKCYDQEDIIELTTHRVE